MAQIKKDGHEAEEMREHEHHDHEHEHEHCCCGHDHEHEHEHEHHDHEHHDHEHEHEHHEHEHEHCCCGHEHGHSHGHDHDHDHGHDHGHSHGGCGCGHDHDHGGEEEDHKGTIIRLIVAAVLLVAAYLLPLEGGWKVAVFAVPYLVIGWDVLWRAIKNITHGYVFDECFLMTVASVGAFCTGECGEGVAVMWLYQLGEMFQDIAADRTRDAITKLTDVRPDTANVEKDGAIIAVQAEQVQVGDVIVIKPGERVPLDGVVISGDTEMDQSALTGESVPKAVTVGGRALSGCVNLKGLIRVKVEKAYGETEVARVLRLVEDASDRKAKSEQFITKFARVYTPAVCGLAVLIAVIGGLATADWGNWIHRALIFLVVSCPCALVISVPLTFFAGIGALSKKGVLVKGGNYLDQLAKAETVVFDKTGTLTEGLFTVDRTTGSMGREELIALAAQAEHFSDHPLARAVCDAYGREVDAAKVSGVEELAGRGVKAQVDGAVVLVGNVRLMKEFGVTGVEEAEGTALYVAKDGAYVGAILLADKPKATAAQAITELKKLGVKKTVMLTGDAQAAAEKAAQKVGVDEFHAGLMPGDKVKHMEQLISGKDRGAVLFVGDGINDAPSLALADAGVAMGAMGSDAAIEAADVVLMDDDPMKLSAAIRGARHTLQIVKQNIALSLIVKAIIMVLGATGVTGMWAAVFADVGVCLVAILNAYRAMKMK